MIESMDLNAVVRNGDLILAAGADIALRIDGEGRWCSMRLGSLFFRRCVDGPVVCRQADVFMQEKSPGKVHRKVNHLVRELLDAVERVEVARRSSGRLRQILDRAAGYTPGRLAAQARVFRAAYPEPVEILPPDRYRDLVVLPALGCPYGKCDFCAFYSGRKFHVLSESEFETHLSRVRRLFGRALPSRPGIFLGGASALSLSQSDLERVLVSVRDGFGLRPNGVAAFMDSDHAPKRSDRAYGRLYELGLRHVTLGLETGDRRLRKALGKPWRPARFQAAVAGLQGAGIRVGLTVLVGPGGKEAEASHVKATAKFIRSQKLREQDIVYLSPLQGSLPEDRMRRQAARLKKALGKAVRAKVAPYRMDLFRFYA